MFGSDYETVNNLVKSPMLTTSRFVSPEITFPRVFTAYAVTFPSCSLEVATTISETGLVEIIGEDKITDMDHETLYYIISALTNSYTHLTLTTILLE